MQKSKWKENTWFWFGKLKIWSQSRPRQPLIQVNSRVFIKSLPGECLHLPVYTSPARHAETPTLFLLICLGGRRRDANGKRKKVGTTADLPPSISVCIFISHKGQEELSLWLDAECRTFKVLELVCGRNPTQKRQSLKKSLSFQFLAPLLLQNGIWW